MPPAVAALVEEHCAAGAAKSAAQRAREAAGLKRRGRPRIEATALKQVRKADRISEGAIAAAARLLAPRRVT